MKIERGIISADLNGEDVHVRGVGILSVLNVNSLFERSYKNGEHVLGIILNRKFTLCHNFKLTTGKKLFGYILNNGFGSTAIRIQLIKDFNLNKYDPYNNLKEYVLGEVVVLKKDNIIDFFD